MRKPIMAKATAVWLVENTTLTFKQIGDFTEMHELEIQGIADGDVAAGVKGFDPIANNQLDREEITRGESEPAYKLKLKHNPAAVGEEKRRGPRYTPLAKRQDRPAAIYWLVKFHPELTDGQISRLIGTTKPTILSIRERSHWNIANINPVDPVALGLCRQTELDQAVKKAAERSGIDAVMGDEERRKLVSTQTSLNIDVSEPKAEALSVFGDINFDESESADVDGDSEPMGFESADSDFDADSFFNLPKSAEEDDEDEGQK